MKKVWILALLVALGVGATFVYSTTNSFANGQSPALVNGQSPQP
jgi:hypothetical protein